MALALKDTSKTETDSLITVRHVFVPRSAGLHTCQHTCQHKGQHTCQHTCQHKGQRAGKCRSGCISLWLQAKLAVGSSSVKAWGFGTASYPRIVLDPGGIDIKDICVDMYRHV